jgi:hypothetical protein
MSLEDIEKELYDQKAAGSLRRRITVSHEDVPAKKESSLSPWAREEERERPSRAENAKASRTARIIIVSLSALLLALSGLAAYYLYQYFTTRDIAVAIEAPAQALVGVPFEVSISANNLSDRSLQAPRLSLMLPDGVLDAQDPDKRTVSFDMDSLDPQESVHKQVELIVVGGTFQTYQLNGLISYGYEAGALSSRFEKKASYGIAAKDAVLSLDFSAPEKVVSGEEFEMRVRYQNIGDEPIARAVFAFDLPESFAPSGSSAALDKGTVAIEHIEPHAEGAITVAGRVSGGDSSFVRLGVTGRMQVAGRDVDIVRKEASVALSSSPLSLSLSSEKKVVYPGDIVQYALSYKNNTDAVLADAVATVAFKGSMFNMSTLQSGGYYNDADDSITWTAANVPDFKQLQPRQSGTIRFVIQVRTEYPSGQESGKDFVVGLQARMTSPTVPANTAASETAGESSLEQRVGGKIAFTQAAYFSEPYSDIRNRGSLPPHVGVPVQYTIHWRLASKGANYKNVRVRAMLGSGIRWTGKVKVFNAQAVPTYNERTQEVVWDAGAVSALMPSGQYAEAVFQVEFVPPSISVGKQFDIIGAVQGEATDAFIGDKKSLSVVGLTSGNLSDPSLPAGFQQIAK